MDVWTYLRQAPPDEWHQVAMHWNWDDGIEPLAWIVRQPACNRGTALMVYWGTGPRYFAQFGTRNEVPAFQRETYDLMLTIERAYVNGLYTRQEIAFDPRNDGGIDWTVRHAQSPVRRHIPAEMYFSTRGRLLEPLSDYEGGYPPGVEV